MVLDPNQLSADGSIALSTTGISEDGSSFAYGTAKSGSQWNIIKIRNVETLKDYPEELHYVRYSKISWMPDNNGFFYSVRITALFHSENILIIRSLIQRYSEDAFKTDKLVNQTVYYHRVNTSQSEDVPIFTHLNPHWRVLARVSNDGNYLLLTFRHNSDTSAHSIAGLPKGGKIKAGEIVFKTIVSHLNASYNVQKKISFNSIISK